MPKPLTQTINAKVRAPAAGPWQEGDPEEAGRYLVEYEEGSIRKVFVADYEYNDFGELRWRMHASEAKVLRYAEINSEHA